MNPTSMNHLQLVEIIKYFSSLTGIHFHSFFKNDKHINHNCGVCCGVCKNCCINEDLLISSYNESSSCNLYFCPKGLCHILYYESDSHFFLLSEPLFCGYPDSSDYKQLIIEKQEQSDIMATPNKCSFLVCLPPAKIYHSSKLFYILINGSTINKDSLCEQFHYNLSLSLAQKNTENAKKFIDEILEQILAKTGLDFMKTKTACVEAIFIMLDILNDYSDKSIDPLILPFNMLASAETLGDLKQCLSLFGDVFIKNSFKNTILKQNTAIYQAIQLLELHYTDKINQNSVAKSVYLSPSYFSKLFKDVTGYTFSQYLNMIRIKKAKELLSSPFITIDSVYKAVGFESRSYFGKIFRRITGTTPRQFRDMATNNTSYN